MNTKTYKDPQQCTTARGLFALIAFILPFALCAQQTNPPPESEEIIELSPFEVRTDRDTSYGAINSTSLTRFNTELNKTPMTADIFTDTFMRDIDALSAEDLLRDFGAGSGVMMASLSGDADQNQPGDRQTFGDRLNAPPLAVRGLSAGYPKRDGFPADSTNTSSTDLWDIVRMEVLRGPQGLLYGAGGAGGTVTLNSKPANFRNKRLLTTFRWDQYGSFRALVDANYGTRDVAVRVLGLSSNKKLRRENLGDNTLGGYVQLAFKLPLRSILRLQGRVTANERWTSNIPTVNLGGTLLDERHGYNLGYLLATNQEGAINPKTGEYYGHVDADTGEFVATGPMANGNVNWKNVASYFGNAYTGKTNNAMGQVTLDTEWTKWLSTSIGASTTKNKEFNRMNGSNLVAPGAGENPFPDDWAVNSNMYDYVNWRKRELLRVSAMTVFNLGRVAKIQTAAGYDYDWLGTGQVDYAYFLSDPNGNIIYGSSPANLRRTTMPSMWWKVSDGPVRNALPRLGTPLIMGRDGQYYVRSEKGPKNPDWISDTNPFGTANKATQEQTGGSLPNGENINASGYQWNRISIDGFWIANYTSWFDERFSTLVGARRTVTHTPITASAVGAQAPQSNNSINLGLDARINDWLRGFYSNSSTYDNPVGFNDPMGYAPPTSKGRGQEVGLKFSPFGSKLSGSLGYYWSQASRLNTSFTNIRQQINPEGLNNYYRGPTNAGTNQWIPLDQKSSGLELIFTSQITKNWSMRVAATRSDGRILETKIYKVVYNDQFWVKGADGQLGTGRGDVAYATGEAFKVPADPSNWTMRTGNYDPNGSASDYSEPGAWIQLTTDMMSDPNNPYYAWGQGNRPNANGQINTGFNNTDTSLVGNMLRHFRSGSEKASTGNVGVPIEQIQYDWPGLTDGSATVMAARKNDYTVGYPVYKIHITSSYQFTQGFLRGFGFIITLSNGWQYRTTYYNDNADDSRNLFSRPELGWIINLNPFYERKFKHFTWRTQLSIYNLFNRYEISVIPNNGTAWAVEANLRSRWDEQPRAYTWTNTFTF